MFSDVASLLACAGPECVFCEKKGTGKQGTPHEKASQRCNLFCYKQ